MKNHERRELVNTLTKIARDYGQTQQLRERIAHALPFDCDVIDAPCVEDARAMGHTGSLADEAERFAFEAWMEGHEWGLGATWDGTGYVSTKDRTLGYPDWHAVSTRMLWAAWRDRAALSKQQSVKIPSNQAQDCS